MVVHTEDRLARKRKGDDESREAEVTGPHQPASTKVEDGSTPPEDSTTEEAELTRLKHLIPSLSKKENVTQLDVILEAIRYIDTLRDRLLSILPESQAI